MMTKYGKSWILLKSRACGSKTAFFSLEYCFQHGSVRKECDNFQMFQDIWPCWSPEILAMNCSVSPKSPGISIHPVSTSLQWLRSRAVQVRSLSGRSPTNENRGPTGLEHSGAVSEGEVMRWGGWHEAGLLQDMISMPALDANWRINSRAVGSGRQWAGRSATGYGEGSAMGCVLVSRSEIWCIIHIWYIVCGIRYTYVSCIRQMQRETTMEAGWSRYRRSLFKRTSMHDQKIQLAVLRIFGTSNQQVPDFLCCETWLHQKLPLQHTWEGSLISDKLHSDTQLYESAKHDAKHVFTSNVNSHEIDEWYNQNTSFMGHS